MYLGGWNTRYQNIVYLAFLLLACFVPLILMIWLCIVKFTLAQWFSLRLIHVCVKYALCSTFTYFNMHTCLCIPLLDENTFPGKINYAKPHLKFNLVMYHIHICIFNVLKHLSSTLWVNLVSVVTEQSGLYTCCFCIFNKGCPMQYVSHTSSYGTFAASFDSILIILI